MSTQPRPFAPAHRFPSAEQLLTLRQASHRLGISLRTLEDWIYDRKIDVVKLGRCVRIKETTIEEIIGANTRVAKSTLS